MTGFEPLDLLQGIQLTLRPSKRGASSVENQYARSVTRDGNVPAQETLARGLRGLRPAVARHRRHPEERLAASRASSPSHDAVKRFDVGTITAEEPSICIAGEILRGLKKPSDCAAFGTRVHAGEAPRRADGLVGRGLRGLLPLREIGVSDFDLSCPIPLSDYPHVLLAHGGGGRLTQRLIDQLFVPSFDNALLRELHDGAVLDVGGRKLAFSTDSFVVKPLFFPGGDIGSLAVHGTVNDLAMCGARPLSLSAGLILEEGLPMDDLWRIVASMRNAAKGVGVPIVTGDTKVVDRGKGDGVFVNVTGIGLVREGIEISPRRARAGDVVLVSGEIAVHGIAIMSVREGLEVRHGARLRQRAARRPRRGRFSRWRGRCPRPARPDPRGRRERR